MVRKEKGLVVVLNHADEPDQDMIDQRVEPAGDMSGGHSFLGSAGLLERRRRSKGRIEPCGVSCKWESGPKWGQTRSSDFSENRRRSSVGKRRPTCR